MARLLFIALLFLPIVCIAGAMTAPGKIVENYVNAEWTMVKLDGVSDNPDGCLSTTYYALDSTQINYNSLNAALLAAQMAGKNVKLWVNGCGGQSSQYPQIKSVITYTN